MLTANKRINPDKQLGYEN